MAAAIDFPAASEILVSFPERWELVRSFRRDEWPRFRRRVNGRGAMGQPRRSAIISMDCRVRLISH